MPPAPPVFRFAPSPNGRLHLGHALSALTNEALALRFGGRLLLRIEDIDLTRCRPEFVEGIEEDLAWLGIRFEPGFRRQSAHFGDYAGALAALRRRGLAYPCFCSRQEIRNAVAAREAATGQPWPVDPDGAPLYPGLCKKLDPDEAARRIAAGEPHVLRLDMAAATAALRQPLRYTVFDAGDVRHSVPVAPERWGDVVLARKDAPTSYHLAVTVDDALQGVTHVVRGRDLEAATDVHVLLQHLLGLPIPLYHFHRLLLDDDGQKLAKSRDSRSLADLRADGISAEEIRRQLGFA
ncbi:MULTISPECIES: tRNA glutamyl-Q(34) synthetase GluQRS [Bosea]|uniref:tRNA glutamyl-Q(34) synthetase GluQRS n=1 Tax=Bosea TaxID=85413 RepID=UPI00215013EB|nr:MULTISPECIES: tRNA glutamyl-Q(34) synthetase GluQRS [Bosea]MCR4524007.1 tRNA glutamyl-Q(34) synthetase GluQRS [Bosea sp. 47.2.35]MDR6831103.1 glutamyl-Q tRNA(Asp) synthetase [Bosea robiniae]MDR6897896.1 glutamyl-Q tRNA(Asp) synthetase [Bosea sp. BE109]MDR7141240.1 glutamyl-Q tRNA(Asp) synthetase [Bosea sp. BE168]MDR7177902.1 glutamyl-Q tRNA(Asp) synthetase [Bosea sp. BE271]